MCVFVYIFTFNRILFFLFKYKKNGKLKSFPLLLSYIEPLDKQQRTRRYIKI